MGATSHPIHGCYSSPSNAVETVLLGFASVPCECFAGFSAVLPEALEVYVPSFASIYRFLQETRDSFVRRHDSREKFGMGLCFELGIENKAFFFFFVLFDFLI